MRGCCLPRLFNLYGIVSSAITNTGTGGGRSCSSGLLSALCYFVMGFYRDWGRGGGVHLLGDGVIDSLLEFVIQYKDRCVVLLIPFFPHNPIDHWALPKVKACWVLLMNCRVEHHLPPSLTPSQQMQQCTPDTSLLCCNTWLGPGPLHKPVQLLQMMWSMMVIVGDVSGFKCNVSVCSAGATLT